MILNVFAADVAAERRRDWLATADAHRLRAQARRSRSTTAPWWYVRVRPIRADDRPMVVAVFAGLGPDSRLARYLSPKTVLNGSEIRGVTEVDHHTRETVLAVTRWRGHAVGMAEFVRNGNDATSAEVAAAVVDEWHGRGVGKLLARNLAERAQRVGIVAFTATMAHDNIRAQRLLADLGEVRFIGRDGATVSYRVSLSGADATRGANVAAHTRARRGRLARSQLGPVANYVAR